MLDDPNMRILDIEDVKAFRDLADDGSGEGRYNDATYCPFASHSLLTNEVDLRKEPAVHERDPDTETVDPQHFWNMMREMFGNVSDLQLHAIFRRFIVLIGGANGLYLRLPTVR